MIQSVRCKLQDDTGEGVELASYRVAKDPEQLQTQIAQVNTLGVNAPRD